MNMESPIATCDRAFAFENVKIPTHCALAEFLFGDTDFESLGGNS